MTKRNTKTAAPVEAAPVEIDADEIDADEIDADEIDADAAASIALRHSVVKSTYKARYAERAATSKLAKGVTKKAMSRSNGDWLAIQLARLVLDEKQQLKVAEFEAILDANGVQHARWNRTTKGWQGRLRMSGSLALRTVVANNAALALPDGSVIEPPAAWCARIAR